MLSFKIYEIMMQDSLVIPTISTKTTSSPRVWLLTSKLLSEVNLMLLRNLSQIPVSSIVRAQVCELIDALVAESDPNYYGIIKPIPGWKIEAIFRNFLPRILSNREETTPIQVNFRQANFQYGFYLITLMKCNQFALNNVMAMMINKENSYEAELMEKYSEGQLIIRYI